MKEQNVFFKRPDEAMRSHLKPFSIREKMENMAINKIFIDGGEAVSLMPHTILKRIGKTDVDTKSHNMVLSNYKSKVGTTLGVIGLTIGKITRPALFMMVK